MHHTQRKLLERTLAVEASKSSQSYEDHAEWISSGFIFRTLCHYNKIFAVWQQVKGSPVIMGRFRVRDFELDSLDGFGICVESDVREPHEDMEWVTHKPQRLFDLPIFAHIPFIPQVSFIPNDSRSDSHVVRVPIVFATRSNPANPKEGDIYVTQISEFRAVYPEFKDLKL